MQPFKYVVSTAALTGAGFCARVFDLTVQYLFIFTSPLVGRNFWKKVLKLF